MKEKDRIESMEHEREDLIAFQTSSRIRELEPIFWRHPKNVYEQVTPLWATGVDSLKWNWELPLDQIPKCSLVENVRILELQRKMWCSEQYRFPQNWRVMERDKTLRVVDKWLQGFSLSAPVIRKCLDGNWIKQDGYHRLTVAMLCKIKNIPIWLFDCPGCNVCQKQA